MELLFVYDDRVAKGKDGCFYTGTTFSQSVFDRYLQYFDHVTLLARSAAPNVDCSRMNRLDPDKVSVKFIPNHVGSIKDFVSVKRNAEFKRSICDEITDNRAVIVRVPSHSGAVAAKYCNKIGKPFLAEVVGCPWDSYGNHSIKGRIIAPLEFLRQRKVVKNGDYIVYVTTEFLQRRYPTKGIAAGISDVELSPVDESVFEKRLEKLKNHSGKLIIGTAAAVNVAYKGQRYVIEALAKCKAHGNTNFEYHLAGGGDQTVLKNLAKKLNVEDQVIFDGILPHAKMFDWMDNLDLYVQPSMAEAMPRALIEAMSRGIPVLAARVGGVPELLGENAIFKKKDINAIAKMLESLNTDDMKIMAEHNFNRAKSFHKERISKKRSDFYALYSRAAKGDM